MKNKTSFHKFMHATSGVKVELALIDDLNAIKTQAYNATRKLYRYKGEMQNDIVNAEKFINQFEDVIKKMKAAAKELGTEINPNFESELKSYRSVIEDYKNTAKTMSRLAI